MSYKKHSPAPAQNELTIINQNNELLVDAKLLHQKLKSKTKFQDWFLRQIKSYNFEEGKDFFSNLRKSTGGRKATDYQLTLDMAKELCMVERSAIGREFRRYFIEAEKELRTKRLYAAGATITEISKTIKPVTINGRKLFDLRKSQQTLGFSTKTSTANIRRAGYDGLIVIFDGKSYVGEEYIKVMMASAKLRALRLEAKAAKPILPENFGQLPLNLKGGKRD